MKNKLLLLIILVAASLAGCKKGLPENPTIVSPINSLIVTVNGTDYIAAPSLVNGKINDTLTLNVQRPSDTAFVKEISLSAGLTANGIEQGSYILFENNLASIPVEGAGKTTTYILKMNFAPPPIVYVPLSSAGYNIVSGQTQMLAAANYDNFYEGFIGFGESWLGFYVVTPTVPMVKYGVNAGFDDGTTEILHQTTSDAPWGDWGTNAVWKFSYNSTTNALTLEKTQWVIVGSATAGNTIPLEFSTDTRLISATADLSAGTFLFDAQTTSALIFGASGAAGTEGKISVNGNAINIAEAGNYTIIMNLSNSSYNSYQIIKN